jgi:hypothetical protein
VAISPVENNRNPSIIHNQAHKSTRGDEMKRKEKISDLI